LHGRPSRRLGKVSIGVACSHLLSARSRTAWAPLGGRSNSARSPNSMPAASVGTPMSIRRGTMKRSTFRGGPECGASFGNGWFTRLGGRRAGGGRRASVDAGASRSSGRMHCPAPSEPSVLFSACDHYVFGFDKLDGGLGRISRAARLRRGCVWRVRRAACGLRPWLCRRGATVGTGGRGGSSSAPAPPAPA
jgi:hypothetical protein